ncbi:MAG: hypothetical protein KI793_06880 [Rivularia sp. (in: Bacteria)]|nr:hypothetical protein [Rivularia sp. MS3]
MTNPVPGFSQGIYTVATYDGKSLAEAIAAEAPKAHVIKAFNLCPTKLWASPAPIMMDGRQHTTPFCGGNAAARKKAASLIEEVGSEPVDLGDIEFARQLEAMGSLIVKLVAEGHDHMTCFQLIQPEVKPIA